MDMLLTAGKTASVPHFIQRYSIFSMAYSTTTTHAGHFIKILLLAEKIKNFVTDKFWTFVTLLYDFDTDFYLSVS